MTHGFSRRSALVAGLSLAFLAACSSSTGNHVDGTDGPSSGNGGSADAGAAGMSGAGGSAPILTVPDSGVPGLGCGADCVAPRHCGVTSLTCLDDGACVASGDCPDGQTCSSKGKCEIGGECGQMAFQIERVAPNIMILLDRSGSMNGDADGDTRWNVAKGAISHITELLGDDIRFGLATYSSCLSGGCSAGSIVVPIAEKNGAAIRAFLDGTVDERSSDGKGTNDDGKLKYLCDSGDPETSTGKSLAALAKEPSLVDAFRQSAVILLTDGAENDECKADCDGPCGAEALLALSPSVKTYVIGLGVNAKAIDAIAKAGGTSASIATDNLSQLSGAFDTITSMVGSCKYALGAAPPNTNELYVFFDDAPTPIPQNTADGWSYDARTQEIDFMGAACEGLQAGTVKNIDVVYGCPKPIIE